MPDNCVLYNLLTKEKIRKNNQDSDNQDKVFSLKEIGQTIQYLVGDIYEHKFCQKPISSIKISHTSNVLKETVILLS